MNRVIITVYLVHIYIYIYIYVRSILYFLLN